MKRLYYQDVPDESDAVDSFDLDAHERRSNEAEFKRRIDRRKEYRFGYFGYLYMKTTESLCCCFAKLCKSYNRRLRSYRKLVKARQKLTAEKDIESLISMRRVNHLIAKVVLKRH
mmetsp:Transcript_31083/g.41190  ORF Transcript_31083/g.41190 Transcript_31083/m.41190 type:complete len:115 (-) Transcript_31083:410-754(-)